MTDNGRPRFLITIDTEGDNLWSGPRTITTHNARHLFRFQELAESYGLRPTYLTSYEMAQSPVFQDLGSEILRRRTGEVGMHLHAWNTPPLVALTDDDLEHQPYLTEYPQRIMEQKVAAITDLLEERFGMKMVSHRAGRWGFTPAYARILETRGYRVDCSVTPRVSWRLHRGDPKGKGGPDYRRFPTGAYFLDLDDISRSGDSTLLEVPVTIVPSAHASISWLHRRLEGSAVAYRALNRLFPAVHWLRPNGRNGEILVRIAREAVRSGAAYLEFMLHSSELMPGGSPRFPTDRHIEALYRDLEALFSVARAACVGATLQQYYERAAVRRLQCV